jgi:hypothetical protein
VIISNSVTSIGNNTFSNCQNLSSLTISKSVTSIGSGAFSECPILNTIILNLNIFSEEDLRLAGFTPEQINIMETFYSVKLSFSNDLPNESYTLFNGLNFTRSSINSKILYSELDNITILTTSDLTNILFSTLVSVIFSNSVESIGDNAFCGCQNLSLLTIPDSVNSIGSYAFYGCQNLSLLTIPDSVNSIGSYAFSECNNLLSLTIPDSVTKIGDSAFQHCFNLSSLTIPDSVNSIGEGAFYGGLVLSTIFLNVKNFKTNYIRYLTSAGFTEVQISIMKSPTSGDDLIGDICFPGNTLVKTDQGELMISKLVPGKHTIRNRRILGISKTVSLDDYLVKLPKDSLYEKVPCRDTLVSRNHLIYYKGRMVKSGALSLFSDKVRHVKYTGEVLYNVIMEEHDMMMVNNLLCETLDPCNALARLTLKMNDLSVFEQSELIRCHNKFVRSRGMFKC